MKPDKKQSAENAHYSSDNKYQSRQFGKRAFVNYSNSEIEETKYIATPSQIAEIVKYCLNMTVAGSGHNKDWLPNVLTAIEGINGTEHVGEKIKLMEAQDE